MSMTSALILAIALVGIAAAPASAQDYQRTIRSCTLIDDDAERLACFDSAYTPVSAEVAPLTPAVIGRLLGELGDPEFTPADVDYRIAQNGYLVRELLIGRWGTQPWEMALSQYRGGRPAPGCRPGAAIEFAPDPDDPLTLNGSTVARDGEAVPAYDLVWRGGNAFVQVVNLPARLASMGMAPDRSGLQQMSIVLLQNGSAWTITPRGPDIMVATSPDVLGPILYVRCPA